jgi:Domain of unknown function (DUF6265)
MKLLKLILLFQILALLSNCHQNTKTTIEKLPVKHEFQKMAWLEGLWANPDDSIRIFYNWQRVNDSLLSGVSWQIKGKDSIPIQLNEIGFVNENIALSIEIFGKNDGLPDEYNMVTNKNGEHVFESTAKEYPQRVIYRLQPDGSLYIRLEGTSEGQARYQEKILTKIK